jgi:hypothetical protein
VDRNGIYLVTASYKDKGVNGLSGLTGFSETLVLKPAVLIEGEKAILNTQQARIIGENARKEGNNNIGYYRNTDTKINWNLYVKTPGRYQVYLYQACAPDKAGSTYELHMGYHKLKGKIQATNDWHDFSPVELGVIEFNKQGSQNVDFIPKQIPNGDLGNIKGIILRKI